MDPSVASTVRRIVARLVARDGAPAVERVAPPTVAPAPLARPETPEGPRVSGPRPLLDAEHVRAAERGTEISVPADAIVTPLALDVARERAVTLRRAPAAHRGLAIAIGSDHGGFRLKQSLASWLAAEGHHVRDLGTASESACDYPDFALAVARAVASGGCAFGIVVDGAGIGSAMTANRVPGVLAAHCFDAASAVNAREHNFANVLTLGAGRLDDAAARKIVTVFLATPEGESRHARRVAKIRALDLQRPR